MPPLRSMVHPFRTKVSGMSPDRTVRYVPACTPNAKRWEGEGFGLRRFFPHPPAATQRAPPSPVGRGTTSILAIVEGRHLGVDAARREILLVVGLDARILVLVIDQRAALAVADIDAGHAVHHAPARAPEAGRILRAA